MKRSRKENDAADKFEELHDLIERLDEQYDTFIDSIDTSDGIKDILRKDSWFRKMVFKSYNFNWEDIIEKLKKLEARTISLTFEKASMNNGDIHDSITFNISKDDMHDSQFDAVVASNVSMSHWTIMPKYHECNDLGWNFVNDTWDNCMYCLIASFPKKEHSVMLGAIIY